MAKIAVHLDSPDDFAKLILSCIAQPRNARRPITRELTSALGISERTPRRHCEYAFGYGPKTLDRVLRMQCYLKLARTNSTLGLTGLAAAAGYADQAHLSREARSLTGLTPKTLLAQLANRRGAARVHKTRRKRLRGSVFQWW